MSQIFINNLQLDAFIGVHPFEQQIKQKLIFNITLDCDFAIAAKNEDIDQTANYQAIIEQITTYLDNNKTKLLETLAYNIGNLILEFKQVDKVNISITKAHAFSNAQVGVSLTLNR